MTRAPLLLIGASGLAVEVAECARRSGREVRGCLDDNPDRVGTIHQGLPVLGPIEDAVSASDDLVVCVGRGTGRRAIVGRLAQQGVTGDRYARVIDPSVTLPPNAQVGAGTILLAGVVITAPVTIGAHVVAMPHVTFTHDDVIEDYATFAAGVALGGGVTVGEAAYLGMNSAVRERLLVGRESTLGMGAALTRDLPIGATWIGVPARPL